MFTAFQEKDLLRSKHWSILVTFRKSINHELVSQKLIHFPTSPN